MRKIQSLVVSMLLVGAGLAGTGLPAQADPYPGTVKTVCKANALNNPKPGKAVRVRMRVDTAGSGSARGNVVFKYQRAATGKVVRQYQRTYSGGGYSKYSFRGVPKGRYVVKVFFDSRPKNSVYKNCGTTFRQRVGAS